MKILLIGDIVGRAGRQCITELLDGIKKEYAIDLTIVNAENAAGGSGLTPRIANALLRQGCDVLTLGDHVWDRQELVDYLDERDTVIRPANFPEGAPGKGWCVVTTNSGIKIGVINLLGRVFMRYNIDCPFRSLQTIVDQVYRETKIICVDFHAETTSEKVAMGHYADGKISALVGTHTHIQTADEKILPQGTAYITDLGMTGPYDSVIGQHKEKIVKRFLSGIPHRFEVAKEDPRLHGVVVDIDEGSGLARRIDRIQKAIS